MTEVIYYYELVIFERVCYMHELRVYSAEWCPDCHAARRVLDERGIEYKLVDIDKTPEAVDIIIAARGKKVVPTLEYNGNFMDGNHFDQEKFERELQELLAD